MSLRKIFIHDTGFCIYESLLIIQFLCNQSAPLLSLQFFHPRNRFLVPISIFANHDTQIFAFPQFSSMETGFSSTRVFSLAFMQSIIITSSLLKCFRKSLIHERRYFSITNSCGKKIIHENRFIIHESFSLLFAAVEKFHPRNRFIIHTRFFSFTGGMWKTFHPKTDLSSTRACFSFPLGCGKLEQNPSDLSAR